jgi:hypothetical protein
MRNMGQIVIDIPSNKNRRYVLADDTVAEMFIEDLEAAAIRLKGNPAKLTRQQIEDIQDGLSADQAVRNSKGKAYSWEQVKRELEP